MAKTAKTARIYTFRPMKRLTFWTLLLAGLQILGLVAWGAGMALWMLAPPALRFLGSGLFVVGYVFGVVMIVISGIVSLVWIYGATRNAHALRPGGVQSSPGWAVAWFFVPIAFLFKPAKNMSEVWVASRGMVNGRYPAPSPWVRVWWAAEIVSGALFRLGDVTTGTDSDILPSTPGNWLMVAATLVSAVATFYFCRLVRDISRNQITSRAEVADIF